jgi:hypothetical protein
MVDSRYCSLATILPGMQFFPSRRRKSCRQVSSYELLASILFSDDIIFIILYPSTHYNLISISNGFSDPVANPEVQGEGGGAGGVGRDVGRAADQGHSSGQVGRRIYEFDSGGPVH